MTYDPAGRAGHKCYLQVVAWEKFQHYKDRNPPWIKFYNSLLEDPGMAALPDASKAHLFGIWLLASRLDNKIPADAEFIARRINATTDVDLKSLMLFGFIEPLAECLQHASNPLATCATTFSARTQSRDRAETERETETEQIPPQTDAASSPGWNREAAELWWQQYKGKPTAAVLFAPLKPIVKLYGWERVRPALVAYLAETEIAFVSIASKFGGAFGTWEEKARGVSRSPPSKQSVGDRTVAAMLAFAEGDRDNEIGVLDRVRQIGSGSTSDPGRSDPDRLPRGDGGGSGA